jgi:hypothetical protein
MPTAEELIVALKSEGAQEVNDDLKTTERRMEGTADAAEEQADRLGGFANKVKGAMAAIVAGLAIGAAGILSQVPVIGEAMAGLKAVFNALALQIDKRLRPGLTTLNKEFFELANAIMSGNFSQVKKELKDIANVIKGFVTGVNITQLIKKFQNFAADAIGGLVTRITKFAQSLTVADFRKFNATLMRLTKRGLKKLINAADWSAFAIALVTMLGKAIVGNKQAIKQEIVDPLVGFIENNWRDWLDSAIQLGKDLVDKLIQGVKNKAGDLANAVENIELAAGVTVGDVADTVGGGGGGGNTTQPTRRQERLFSGRGTTLDGRQLSESTGRYRADPSRRRNI